MPKKTDKASEEPAEERDVSPTDATTGSENEIENEEEGGDESAEGVDVPEEFQQKAHELIHKATRAHISHIRGKLSDREQELRDEEEEENKGKKGGIPETMSAEDMPAD
jgi:hypothetical protein